MNLTHFSRIPFHYDSKTKYTFESKQDAFFKPRGLWLSDENSEQGWHAWCTEQEWGLAGLRHRTEFIVDLEKVLQLKTLKEFINFTDNYRAGVPYMRHSIFIDWAKVKKDYAGIAIIPYQWQCRLEPRFSWYYGWDCASACIWDLSCASLPEKSGAY